MEFIHLWTLGCKNPKTSKSSLEVKPLSSLKCLVWRASPLFHKTKSDLRIYAKYINISIVNYISNYFIHKVFSQKTFFEKTNFALLSINQKQCLTKCLVICYSQFLQAQTCEYFSIKKLMCLITSVIFLYKCYFIHFMTSCRSFVTLSCWWLFQITLPSHYYKIHHSFSISWEQ